MGDVKLARCVSQKPEKAVLLARPIFRMLLMLARNRQLWQTKQCRKIKLVTHAWGDRLKATNHSTLH